MKITVCTYRLTGGGAERVASLWIKGFHDIGYDVSVILGDSYVRRQYQIPENVRVYDVNPHIPIRKVRYAWMSIDKSFALRKMKKVLSKIKPDIVIAVLPSWGPLIYEAKGKLNFKVIGTDHNAYELPEGVHMSEEQRFLKFDFNKCFDKVTVLTEADRKVIGDRLSNVSVLPNPLTFEPVMSIPAKKKIVLAAGRLDIWYVKGFDLLVKAWGLISKKYPDWILQIAGTAYDEKQLEQVKQFIVNSNVQHNVRLMGYCEDIKKLYQDASIFVMSSRCEGFGMVLTEAMSQGCACIASDFKGRQSEIIRNESEGLICPINDIQALSDAIEKMISNDEYRYNVQLRSIERAKDFQLERIMQKWQVIFSELNY